MLQIPLFQKNFVIKISNSRYLKIEWNIINDIKSNLSYTGQSEAIININQNNLSLNSTTDKFNDYIMSMRYINRMITK